MVMKIINTLFVVWLAFTLFTFSFGIVKLDPDSWFVLYLVFLAFSFTFGITVALLLLKDVRNHHE